tara:strand:- start:1170 stop:1397 length:228 start_codon:yes stop_codon:yes gene_type:complete
MYKSESFGRIFWVDDNYDLQSCPQYVDGTGDFDNADYVSEWQDWEGVNYDLLLKIYKTCIFNKQDYGGSLSHTGV